MLIVVYLTFGADLTEKQRSKLHPLFRSLITNSSQPLAKTTSKLQRSASTVSEDGTVRYSSIVYTRDVETVRAMGIHVNSVLPEFVTAQLTPSDMIKLADLESVRFLDPGKVHHPLLDVSVPETGAALLHSGFINNTPYKGAGAIVLIYDTGIDWKHMDFRKAGDTTKSRILYIWDQTLDSLAGDKRPIGFNYGVEYTQAQIENEFKKNRPGLVREKDTYGHGTHVASIAAGNGQAFNNKYIGMAPEADIIMVKGGDSFTEAKEIDGLTYAQNKAAEKGEPIVVNMSLGGQVGPHDGTNPDEVAVNSFVNSNSGRVVCIAAGNDGANPIHMNGSVTNGSSIAISISVPSYTPHPSGKSDNYFVLDIWLQDNKALNATVKSPNNIVFSSQLNNEVYGPNQSDGTIDIYDEIDSPYSHRHLQVYIYDATSSVPKTGTWTITLNTTETSVAYDAWIDSDLNGPSASFTTGGNTNKTVAMPGTAAGAITVGSYVTKWSWTSSDDTTWNYIGSTDRTGNISTFSSIGSTADNRQKPDIAAPGQGIVAAFSGNDTSESTSHIIVSNKYLLMQGTSMATPHVTGATALLLSVKPSLTANQIKNYFTSTARTDAFTSTVWNSSWGFGKMDIYKAMASAVGASGASRVTLSYNTDSIVGYTPITNSGNRKLAIRFTPTTTGKLTSIAVNINGGVSAIKGTGNLKVSATQSVTGSVGYIPSTTQIGNSVLVPFSSLNPGVTNVIDFSSSGVSVKTDTDFQIVLENTNASDTLQILLDDGTLNINRTSSYRTGANGVLGWYNRHDPNYTSGYKPTYYNLFITAEIAATVVTNVDRISSTLPTSFSLKQNYPNPFNPSTNIEYSIPVKGLVKLQIFDILGRSIATLVNTTQEAGVYHTAWDGKAAASGVYFYKLESGSFSKTERMLLLK
jgi:subtilisin family serine protease